MHPSPRTSFQQGHLQAAQAIGGIYFWGQGAAIDYPRAMAAYKVGAEGGLAVCQYQVGMIYYDGRGVDVDYKQAWAWLQKPRLTIARGRVSARWVVHRG